MCVRAPRRGRQSILSEINEACAPVFVAYFLGLRKKGLKFISHCPRCCCCCCNCCCCCHILHSFFGRLTGELAYCSVINSSRLAAGARVRSAAAAWQSASVSSSNSISITTRTEVEWQLRGRRNSSGCCCNASAEPAALCQLFQHILRTFACYALRHPHAHAHANKPTNHTHAHTCISTHPHTGTRLCSRLLTNAKS